MATDRDITNQRETQTKSKRYLPKWISMRCIHSPRQVQAWPVWLQWTVKQALGGRGSSPAPLRWTIWTLVTGSPLQYALPQVASAGRACLLDLSCGRSVPRVVVQESLVELLDPVQPLLFGVGGKPAPAQDQHPWVNALRAQWNWPGELVNIQTESRWKG